MTRPMVTVGAAFLGTMLALSMLPRGWGAVLPVLFLLGAALLLIAVLMKKPRRTFWCAVVSAALAACFCWMGFLQRNSFDFQSLAGATVQVEGAVTEIRPTSGTRLAVTLSVTECERADGTKAGTPQETPIPKRFTGILYVPGETAAEIGSTLSVRAKCLSMPSTPGFDLASYYQAEGISLTLSTYDAPSCTAPVRRPLWSYPKLWNQRLCEQADRIYPQPYSGLIRAVLLGDKSQIDAVLYNTFSRAGITHVFVVSGTHVSLMAGLLYLLFKRLNMPSRLRGALCCLAAWGFVALTGFGLPAVRAGIMATVMLAGTMFRRPSDALNSLCLAGTAMVLFHPAAISSGSFQLSMTATLGVILLARPISEWIAETFRLFGKPGQWLSNLLGCSFGANLMMFPVMWKLFGGISLVFPLSNLVAIPLLPAVLVLSALSLVMAVFGWIPEAVTGAVVRLTEAVLWLIIRVSEWLTSFHGCYLGLDYPLVGIWLAAGLLLVLGTLAVKQRKLAVRSIWCLFALLACGLLTQNILEKDTVKMTPVLSFEGASIVIEQGRRVTVVALTDDGRVDQAVEELLRGHNVQTVENLLLSYQAPAELTDTVYLSRTMNIGRVFAGEELELLPYAQELLKPSAGEYLLQDGHGYELTACPGGGFTEVYREDGEDIVLATVGGVRVGITDSLKLANRSDCEILIYGGKNPEKIRKIPLKYVILLTKPAGEDALPPGVWPAYERQGTLFLNGAGRFRMEETAR